VPSEHAAKQPVGSIQLYRPAAARDDHTVKLILDAQGRQNIPTAALARGLWKVRVVWKVGERDYGLDESVVLPPPKS
jgi:nitrogen fixation protein FixH